MSAVVRGVLGFRALLREVSAGNGERVADEGRSRFVIASSGERKRRCTPNAASLQHGRPKTLRRGSCFRGRNAAPEVEGVRAACSKRNRKHPANEGQSSGRGLGFINSSRKTSTRPQRTEGAMGTVLVERSITALHAACVIHDRDELLVRNVRPGRPELRLGGGGIGSMDAAHLVQTDTVEGLRRLHSRENACGEKSEDDVGKGRRNVEASADYGAGGEGICDTVERGRIGESRKG
ncbi:hypothetical protein DFH09DRAFT_1409969 [Mycena vulgaris]|nr:hypothetical protein DFH09DRAFT_1409969 [Mycena vulgaris]